MFIIDCHETAKNLYQASNFPWRSPGSIGIFGSISKLMILDFLVLPSKFEGSWDKMDKLILIVHVIYRLKSMLMCHDMANEITFLNYLCYTVQLMLLCHDITNEITYSYRQVNYKLDESINIIEHQKWIIVFISMLSTQKSDLVKKLEYGSAASLYFPPSWSFSKLLHALKLFIYLFSISWVIALCSVWSLFYLFGHKSFAPTITNL